MTPSDFTDRLPLFHGLGGVHVSPADLLVLTLLVIWLLKRGTSQTVAVTRSPLTYAIGALLVAVGVGVVVGQAHHGALRTSFTEVRPYFYLAVAYLVATVFATRLEILRLAMWALVLGSGFKAAQALYSFMHVRNQLSRPDFIVGHEEALFFALFIILTLSLWLFQIPGRLRTTATMLLPLVFLADLVNSRRAAWLILGGALIALTAVTMARCPCPAAFHGPGTRGRNGHLGVLLPGVLEPHGGTGRARPRGEVGGVAEHARRIVGRLSSPGEPEPQVQHQGRRRARERVRPPDRQRVRDHRTSARSTR